MKKILAMAFTLGLLSLAPRVNARFVLSKPNALFSEPCIWKIDPNGTPEFFPQNSVTFDNPDCDRESLGETSLLYEATPGGQVTIPKDPDSKFYQDLQGPQPKSNVLVLGPEVTIDGQLSKNGNEKSGDMYIAIDPLLATHKAYHVINETLEQAAERYCGDKEFAQTLLDHGKFPAGHDITTESNSTIYVPIKEACTGGTKVRKINSPVTMDEKEYDFGTGSCGNCKSQTYKAPKKFDEPGVVY